MGPLQRKYSDAEREAVSSAYNDRGIRPAERVSELAAAGELTRPDGSKVDAFEIGPATVRTLARRHRLNRTGETASELAKLPPRDAVEALRRRMLNVCDYQLERLEKAQRRKPDKPVDYELLRQIARATREIAAIPGPKDPRPVQPGQRDETGQHTGGTTRGGLAGQLLADHERERRQGTTAQNAQQTHTHTDNGAGSAASHVETGTEPSSEGGSPGAAERLRVAALPT